jgi:hypothetical protein
MVAATEISPSVNVDDFVASTEPVLAGKVASEAETPMEANHEEAKDKEDTVEDDSSPRDENERTDFDEPRVDTVEEPTEEVAADVTEKMTEPTPTVEAEPTSEGEMSDETAKDVLERYAFGAGMRMYARSLALAELAEKEKNTKLLKKAPSSSLGEPPPLKTVPSAKSVLSFETVKSEISKLVQSFGSQDRSTAVNTKTRELEEEDDDVVDAITHASEETEPKGSSGLCGSDEALADVFHQAEIWAEKVYDSMSRETRRQSRTAKRSYNKWWSSMFSRKSRAVNAKELSLEETSLEGAAAPEPWWSSVLCAPVILEEDENLLHDDDKQQKETSASPINETYASQSNKSQWELPFTGMIQKWFTKTTVEPVKEETEAIQPAEEDEEIPAPNETEPVSVDDQRQE